MRSPALEVELAMTEAHVKRLSATALNQTDSHEENQMAALLKEENERAEALKRKIHELKDYS